MATKQPPLAKADAKRGVLAANVLIHGAGPDGQSVWYGPSYPENGEPPAEAAARLPKSVWDTKAVWPTPDDAARVNLQWDGPPDSARASDTGGED